MTEKRLYLTPSQLRAARAAVHSSVDQIADLSGVGRNTIRRLEKGEHPKGVTTATLAKLQRAYEQLSITFLSDDGESGAGIRHRSGEPE